MFTGWAPDNPGWRIVDAMSRRLIDPVILATDEKIKMTSWELHDTAVQVVRHHLMR